MSIKMMIICLSAFILSWGASLAQAGVIRSTGKEIGKGAAAVAGTTADAAQATAGGVKSAGTTTGGAVKRGVTAVGQGAAATPRLAKKAWKAIW